MLFHGDGSRQSLSSFDSKGNVTPTDNVAIDDSIRESAEDFDPVFNLMDNYTALLSCAFLHMELINSLFVLGVEGSMAIATKSRALLVSFMQILSYVLPENSCAELLTNPALMDLAVTTGSMHKAHKSSQMLIDLAEAFSLMPCKLTSGSHISNLSGSTLPSNNPSSGRTRSSSSAIRNPNNVGSVQKSNFQPLNIKTIYELAEEIKISSLSTISINGRKFNSPDFRPSSPAGTASDLLYSLRSSLTPLVDKNDFIKQMDQSRVIGNQGKEPFKWDWVTISDMLEYSFANSERLNEALRTKWVRRVSGFYRCTLDEKGFFANLDWEPTNLQYLESACNLYSVLLKDEQGRVFLTSDRRGMLFNQMATELEQLIQSAERPSLGPNSTTIKNVFRPFSCTCTMAREFFTLLGRIVRNPGSRRLLDNTNIFPFLSRMGAFKQLDYISRTIATALFFHDGGTLSKHIVQFWIANGCSTPLRHYVHNLLRAMALTLSTNDPCYWCVESIVTQLTTDDNPSDALLKALGELVHSKSSLRVILAKRPRALVSEPALQDTLVRFLAIPEGVQFLKENGNWLETAMNSWASVKCKEYVHNVEEKLGIAICRPSSLMRDEMINRLVEPIPVKAPEFVREMIARQGITSTAALGVSGFSQSGAISGRNPNVNLVNDMRGFLRLPWNIEIKLTTQMGYGGQDSSNSPGEYLRVDSFLDTSDMASPLSYETTSDLNRIFKVRGILLDQRGNPSGQPILPTSVIHSTLMTGICPVTKTGSIQATLENRPVRRRSSAANPKEAERGTASTTRGSLANSAGNSINGSMVGGAGGSGGDADFDIPVSLGQESNFEWFTCRPGHRQGNIAEMDDGRFSVTLPGEPIVFIFSRRAPGSSFTSGTPVQRLSRAGSLAPVPENTSSSASTFFDSNRNNRMDASRAGNLFYLVEVQYYFRLETGNVWICYYFRSLSTKSY